MMSGFTHSPVPCPANTPQHPTSFHSAPTVKAESVTNFKRVRRATYSVVSQSTISLLREQHCLKEDVCTISEGLLHRAPDGEGGEGGRVRIGLGVLGWVTFGEVEDGVR